MPLDTWQNGNKFNFVPVEGYLTVAYFCHALLGDTKLIRRLQNENFDVVLVDLLYNECSLALAHHLGQFTIVVYWCLLL